MHITFDKRLHKADTFSVKRFEIILYSDCTVESHGGGESWVLHALSG